VVVSLVVLVGVYTDVGPVVGDEGLSLVVRIERSSLCRGSVGIKVGFLTRVVGVLLVGDRWVCVVVAIGRCQCRFFFISSICVSNVYSVFTS